MQYKVPQNIDIEDKVIAGLTLRQFMFILVAGGFGLLEYYFFTGPLGFLFFPIALITAGIGFTFAFIKINDRPFEIFAMSALKSLVAPRTRVWQKDDDIEIPKQEMPKVKKVDVQKKKSLGEVRSSLQKLATVVDSGGVSEIEEVIATRTTNIKTETKDDPNNVEDLLAKTEEGSASVDQYITQAKEYVEKTQKEPPISKVATKEPTKQNFEYEKLELADENKLKETLNEVKEKQKKLEEKFENAKIIKNK